jgi:thioredoxin-dependent peroxiredoxin
MEILLLVLFVTIVFVLVVTFAQRGEPLAVGAHAPALRLVDVSGNLHDVAAEASRARGAVVAFLPRDATSRCLNQFREFAELDTQFNQAGYKVYFVAVATHTDNATYATKNRIAATLLADPSGASARAYGSIIDFLIYRFAKRTTYVIDATGKVIDVQVVVEPNGHAKALLSALQTEAGTMKGDLYT